MSDIAGNITSLKRKIPTTVKVVAVSKTMPVSDIQKAYDAGQRIFGENRVQELLYKKDLLPRDIEWHAIGHLQTNKVKVLIPFIHMIESVDSFKLLKIINTEASKIPRIVDCLLQIHIAMEDTKFGFNMEELEAAVASDEFAKLCNVRVCGIMGMATFTSDNAQIHREFRYLADCYKLLKMKYFIDRPEFSEISMGMSGDYEIALIEGSTLVRVGSLIFGERTFHPE